MDFLHTEFSGGREKVVVVTVDTQCNVMLLNDASFRAYQRGQSFKYSGGWAIKSPVRLQPPRYGHWHVVVDLAGRSGSVRAGIRVISRDASPVV